MKRYLISYKKNDNVLEVLAENCIHENGHYYFENVKTKLNNVPLQVIKDDYVKSVEEIEVKAVI